MNNQIETVVLGAFQRAAKRVPAYRTLLEEAGISYAEVKTIEDFARIPILTKANTFQRFPIERMCIDGELGRLGSVLTSSGHSGVFAFGLNNADSLRETANWIDDILDGLFAVRSQSSMLVNCLPMGVKVPTLACTLAETSVRPDMVVGLVRAFKSHFSQFILVGDAAFVKHVLELGQVAGIDWPAIRVHVILGEESLAENARKYIEGILGIDLHNGNGGMVFSSMGVGELGLHIFSEVPPTKGLIQLRRALHDNPDLRQAVLGEKKWIPTLFTYDPKRIFIEFDHTGRLVITTLNPSSRIPLIRYASGDFGRVFNPPPNVIPEIESLGVPWLQLASLPIVSIEGRGQHALAADSKIYPEAVKEGIYFDPDLARLTTANFRLVSGAERARIRIQLSPRILPETTITRRFNEAIGHYVDPCFDVVCEPYESFGSGMSLDYERKFDYLGS